MSNPISNFQPTTTSFDDQQTSAGNQTQSPFVHRVHKEDEILPGARNPDAMEYASNPTAELGGAQSGFQHDSNQSQTETMSPGHFTKEERRDAPLVAGAIQPPHFPHEPSQPQVAGEHRDAPVGSGAVAADSPYERTPLQKALDATSDSQEFEKNPLKTPADESQKHHLQSQLESTHAPTQEPSTHQPQADQTHRHQSKPFVPAHVGTTESREGGVGAAGQGVGAHSKAPPADTLDTSTEADTKPSIADKVIGATEKIAGKVTRNPDLQEKGQLRTQGTANVTHEPVGRN